MSQVNTAAPSNHAHLKRIEAVYCFCIASCGGGRHDDISTSGKLRGADATKRQESEHVMLGLVKSSAVSCASRAMLPVATDELPVLQECYLFSIAFL